MHAQTYHLTQTVFVHIIHFTEFILTEYLPWGHVIIFKSIINQ